jgi:hypothetical protein
MDVLERIKMALLEDLQFNAELETWCMERCGAFRETPEGEHKLEWTAIHGDFCQLFEAKITSILTEGGHSVEEFWQKLTKAADGDDEMFNEAFLLQCLAAIIDYDQFVVTMRGLQDMGAE